MITKIKVAPPSMGLSRILFLLGTTLIVVALLSYLSEPSKNNFNFGSIVIIFSVFIMILAQILAKNANGLYEYSDVTNYLMYKTQRLGKLRSFLVAKKTDIVGIGVNTYSLQNDRGVTNYSYAVFIVKKDKSLVELSDSNSNLTAINDLIVKYSKLFDSPAFFGEEKMFPKIILQGSQFESIDYVKNHSAHIDDPEFCKDPYYVWTMRVFLTTVILFFLSLGGYLLWETLLFLTGH